MKQLSSTIIEKLSKLENFSLVYDNGKTLLWNISAPGLHVLPVAYHYMKFAGERGRWSLFYHSYTSDFFKKVYDILNRAGLKEDFSPEIWGYIRKLNKYASSNSNPEIKANTNIQLFTFIQDFLENLLYNEFVSRTNITIKENRDIFKELLVAADSFVVRNSDGTIQIMAGYPWFDMNWCRDTFISFPGILLVTQRYEYAKSVFSFYAKQQNKEGLLPSRILQNGQKEYLCADGSLWFIEALNRYQLSVQNKDADTFIKKMIPTVNKIIDYYINSSGVVYMDKDNLIMVPQRWTWMDASVWGNPVTPRYGKPVEIQALFYNALGIASKFNLGSGNKKLSQIYDKVREDVGKSINERFYSKGMLYPYDVIDGDPHGTAIRPNAVFLLSLSCIKDLLSQPKKEAIVWVIEKELLTPCGLRSLSLYDEKYIGRYNTFDPLEVKDLAYHHGTVWPYFMSHYIRAKKEVMVEKQNLEFVNDVKDKIKNLFNYIRDNETVPEVFSGSEPYAPGGAVSQCWSVGAMLEIIDLLNSSYNKQGEK